MDVIPATTWSRLQGYALVDKTRAAVAGAYGYSKAHVPFVASLEARVTAASAAVLPTVLPSVLPALTAADSFACAQLDRVELLAASQAARARAALTAVDHAAAKLGLAAATAAHAALDRLPLSEAALPSAAEQQGQQEQQQQEKNTEEAALGDATLAALAQVVRVTRRARSHAARVLRAGVSEVQQAASWATVAAAERRVVRAARATVRRRAPRVAAALAAAAAELPGAQAVARGVCVVLPTLAEPEPEPELELEAESEHAVAAENAVVPAEAQPASQVVDETAAAAAAAVDGDDAQEQQPQLQSSPEQQQQQHSPHHHHHHKKHGKKN